VPRYGPRYGPSHAQAATRKKKGSSLMTSFQALDRSETPEEERRYYRYGSGIVVENEDCRLAITISSCSRVLCEVP